MTDTWYLTIILYMFVVVQFYPWFKIMLFSFALNSLLYMTIPKHKGKQNLIKGEIEPQHLMLFKRFVIVSKGFYSIVQSFPVFKDFKALAQQNYVCKGQSVFVLNFMSNPSCLQPRHSACTVQAVEFNFSYSFKTIIKLLCLAIKTSTVEAGG